MIASNRLTAAQEILLAADDLDKSGHREFTEWDLTVAAWSRSRNRFGCRGYEEKYPDHKRVMMEIMGTTKKDNPLRRGWFIKTKINHYAITPLGQSEADRFRKMSGEMRPTEKSAQHLYDTVHPYIEHTVFRKFIKDPQEPRTWLGAASFLKLTRNDAQHLTDQLRLVESSAKAALDWLKETNQLGLRRGVTGGGVTITQTDLKKLQEFLAVLKSRFEVQINAVMKQHA